MKKLIYCVVIAVLLCAFVLGCAPKPAPAPAPAPAPPPAPAPAPVEPITWKAIATTAPQSETTLRWKRMVCDRITELSNGEVVIEYIGGPEAIPARDQVEAVKSGVVDILCTRSSLYEMVIPEMLGMQISELTPWEEREPGGFYDYMVELHKERMGLFYLGRGYVGGIVFLTNPLVLNPRTDFKGLKIASVAPYPELMTKLGIVEVIIPFGDVYTALERGTAKGLVWPIRSIVDLGFSEVLKYYISHEWWYRGAGSTVINLNSWNQLSKHVQDLAISVQNDFIRNEYEIYWEEEVPTEEQAMLDAGMETIVWSEEDAKWFFDLVTETRWIKIMERCPDTGPIIREMITKK